MAVVLPCVWVVGILPVWQVQWQPSWNPEVCPKGTLALDPVSGVPAQAFGLKHQPLIVVSTALGSAQLPSSVWG